MRKFLSKFSKSKNETIVSNEEEHHILGTNYIEKLPTEIMVEIFTHLIRDNNPTNLQLANFYLELLNLSIVNKQFRKAAFNPKLGLFTAMDKNPLTSLFIAINHYDLGKVKVLLLGNNFNLDELCHAANMARIVNQTIINSPKSEEKTAKHQRSQKIEAAGAIKKIVALAYFNAVPKLPKRKGHSALPF